MAFPGPNPLIRNSQEDRFTEIATYRDYNRPPDPVNVNRHAALAVNPLKLCSFFDAAFSLIQLSKLITAQTFPLCVHSQRDFVKLRGPRLFALFIGLPPWPNCVLFSQAA